MSDHTSYNARRGVQLFRWDSYVGGEDYRHPRPSTLSTQRLRWYTLSDTGAPLTQNARYTSYLVPFRAEDDRSYEARLSCADYINVVQPIVDAYARGVTSEVHRDLGDVVGPLSDDVDLRGTAWPDFAESLARWTALYGEMAVVVDAPRLEADEEADSRASELAAGNRPYAVLVHPTSWAWTVEDDLGRVIEFAWVERARYPEGTVALGSACVHLRVLRRGEWELREIDVPWVAGQAMAFDRGGGKVVASGKLPASLGGDLPVAWCFFRRDESSAAPRGLSLVADACEIARKIYNRRSWADTIAMEAGFPTLAIPSGGTGGQLDPAAKVEIGTSKALGYSANAGAPQWIQPSAEWFEKLHARNSEDIRTILRTTAVDSDGDAGAASSGEALRIRSRDFESMARTFARHMRACEKRLASLLALYAGGDPEEPEITYPARFVLPDKGGDFARALSLLKDSPVELGPKAKAVAAEQMIDAALVLDDQTRAEICDEIEALLEQDAARYQREMSGGDAPSAQSPDGAAPSSVSVPLDAQAKDPTTALNGAQVTSLLEIVSKAAARQIPRDTAIQLIVASFPIDQEQASRILGKVGASFFADPQA